MEYGKERRLGYIWAWVVFFIDIRLDVYCSHLCFLELFPKHGEMIYSHDKRSLSQLKKLCYVQSNVYANYTLHVSLDASLTPKQLEKGKQIKMKTRHQQTSGDTTRTRA
jgi:hypothetical protein